MRAGRIGVGIIGASPNRGWGTTAHLPALRGLPDFAVTAVSASSRAHADETAKRFDVPNAFTDPFELASHRDVDLVAVTVRVPEHGHLVRAVLKARKHIYCEWPLGRDTDEAAALFELAKQSGVRHMVGLQARGSPALNQVRELVRQGSLGRVTSVDVLQVSGGASKVQDVHAYTLDLATGANHLTISAGHFLDAIGFCVSPLSLVTGALLTTHYPSARSIDTGAEVRRTSPDSVVVSGVLENGATLAFHSFSGSSAHIGIHFRISGTDGDLLIESAAPRGVQSVPLTLRGARAGASADREMSVIEGSERFRWVPATVPDGPPLGVAQMYAKLGESIRGGAPATPDFGTAVANHRLLDAIRAASERGREQAGVANGSSRLS